METMSHHRIRGTDRENIMDLRNARILVIGGAGLIGSHVVEALLREDVKEVLIFDNFCRGTHENIQIALRNPRCKLFDAGGDIL